MSEFTPTEEQLAIVEAAAKTNDSLIIEALAGAAKTTTLVMLAHKLPMVPAVSVSFNKKIADEMGKRMPGHISSSTMNSLGHRVWGQALGKRLTVESGKLYEIVKTFVDRNLTGEDQKFMRENMASVLRTLRRAKSSGYIPELYATLGKPLVDLETFFDGLVSELDFEPDDLFAMTIDKCLEISIAQAYSGLIDFDDQIYMSTLFQGNYPRFPIVLVDEAQDLSPLNHVTLTKMVGGRIIAVGDPYQSIYGFRGADHNSMNTLQHLFNMRKLTLSTSFRCPISVVERAQRRVPHMNYPEWAIPGKVERLTSWDSDSVPEVAAIICRNNAPLFHIAMKLIRAGRAVKMKMDIGPAMIKKLSKLGPGTMTQEAAYLAINEWRETEISKAREARHAVINDQAECLRVFVDQGPTLSAAISFAEHVFASAGTIQLMTGHGAKGLEFETVFHLDPWRVPSKHAQRSAEAGDFGQMEQELNLRYVIETRSKETLFLCNVDDFQ